MQHCFDVSGPWAMNHLIDTLLEEWQDTTDIIYDLLWESATPTLLREIDCEAFYVELTTLQEEARDDELEFHEVDGVPLEMNIYRDVPPPTLDVSRHLERSG
ncbi:hypothetical protein Adt_42385 [Abeliophyllum distichum]|uniref:Uncharacterized protein n=1 Tax=Abeliophyllum distichum TaxID=126358 RepID=A0ABD1PRI2_9LAMI